MYIKEVLSKLKSSQEGSNGKCSGIAPGIAPEDVVRQAWFEVSGYEA